MVFVLPGIVIEESRSCSEPSVARHGAKPSFPTGRSLIALCPCLNGARRTSISFEPLYTYIYEIECYTNSMCQAILHASVIAPILPYQLSPFFLSSRRNTVLSWQPIQLSIRFRSCDETTACPARTCPDLCIVCFSAPPHHRSTEKGSCCVVSLVLADQQGSSPMQPVSRDRMGRAPDSTDGELIRNAQELRRPLFPLSSPPFFAPAEGLSFKGLPAEC